MEKHSQNQLFRSRLSIPGQAPRLLTQKFTRQSRLLRAEDFRRVFQQPFRTGDNYFRILARPSGISCHRLGLAVSKKVCPKAVGRNRIKRLVRENFRTHMAGLLTASEKKGGGLDFVVLPTAQAASQSSNVLDESLSTHWQELIIKAANREAGKHD